MATTDTATITFADGTTMAVPATLHPSVEIVGKTIDGLLCVTDATVPAMPPWALTPCCHASGKGVEWGIACRACYMPAPDDCGDCGWHLVAVKVTP